MNYIACRSSHASYRDVINRNTFVKKRERIPFCYTCSSAGFLSGFGPRRGKTAIRTSGGGGRA